MWAWMRACWGTGFTGGLEWRGLPNILSTRDPLQSYRHIQTESEALCAKGNQKKPRVIIIVSDKIDFKIKTMINVPEEHYIMIKGSIREEDMTIVNIYASDTGAPQYMRQMLTATKEEIDS